MVTRRHRVDKKVRYGKIRIYLLIFFLLSTLIFMILFKTSYFEISDIVVNNNIEVSKEEIVAYSGVNIGDNTFKLKISDIREKIIRTPFIKDVTIKRKLPSKLMIEVMERQKIAAIHYMGLYFFVDNEGVILYTSNEIDGTYVIEGFEFESFTEGEKIRVKSDEDLKKSIQICGMLEGSDLAIKPKITCIEGEFSLYLNESFRIKLGRGENIERRFAIFESIYKDLISKNVDTGVVDISHDGYPTYSPFGE